MNTMIFFLVCLALALSLGLIALDDPGYVLISREPYEIEVSLALFGVLIVMLFALVYFAVRLVMRSLRARSDLSDWQDKRARQKATREMIYGYAKLIEGDWAEAERELTQRLDHSETPLLNYLGAAYAAQQVGDYSRRDQYLGWARKIDRKFRDAVDLTQARLQYQAGQYDAVRLTLDGMSTALKRRPLVERMEAELLRQNQDWNALEQKLPLLKKHNAYGEQEILELEHQTYSHVFDKTLDESDNSNEITRTWSSLPKEQRKDPEMLRTYVEKLLTAGKHDQAEDTIKLTLNQEWMPELLWLFDRIYRVNEAERTRQYLVWLEKHPQDPVLLQLLARQKNKEGELEQAQDYYSSALRNGADRSAYLELGALLEKSGEHAEALKCYRRGLEVKITRTKAAPVPAPPVDETH